MRRKFLWGVAILAGIVALVNPPPAEAGFRMRVEVLSGAGAGTGAVITDQGAGDNQPVASAPGTILFTGAIGNFTINVTTGTSHPPLPPIAGAFSFIDLSNVSVFSGSGGGTLRITLENDGFTGGGGGPLALVGAVGGTLSANASVTFQSYADGTNAVPNLGGDVGTGLGTIGAVGAFGGIPGTSTGAWGGTGVTFGTAGAFSAMAGAGFNAGSSYSLFSTAVLTFTGNGNVSWNHSTYSTPEPATIVTALAGLPVLGGLIWRRRRTEVKVD